MLKGGHPLTMETPIGQRLSILAVVVVFVLCGSQIASAQTGDPLSRAKPEAAGMSSQRLARIAEAVNGEIARGQIPGAVLAIARHGKLVYFETFGFRDKAVGVPMSRDTIFNVASMTKPMTAVAALQLYEQGKLLMDEPVSTYFPALGKMQVAVMDSAQEKVIGRVPMTRPITIQDLLRHTSGLIYGNRGDTAVHKMYPASSNAVSTTLTGAELIQTLSSLPLGHQPGAQWEYGFGLDVLGLVVEKITGQSLGQYLEAQVFKPLGMTDTAFHVEPGTVARYAKGLPTDPVTGQPQSGRDLSRDWTFECGGGCAASTAVDYLRFASMLLNKGALGDVRVLGRKTVEYMTSHQLPLGVRLSNAGPPDYGFGLGVAVRTTPGIARLMGSVGDFTWGGASGTNWWADPHEGLAVVWMAYSPGALRLKYRQMINALVYQAIVE
jgi:CubicO group peptidase (beta-lactamase class C family)